MKKRIIALLIAALAVVSAGCTAGEKSSGSETSSASESSRKISPKSKEKRKIIIDTDTAGDDAVAMIIAAKTENVEILGVTVSEGNVGIEQAVKNALMTLEVAGCDAPVYRGASKSYTGKKRETFSVYGKDGRGDNDLIHPTRTAEDKGAVDFIIETVNANPGEVEIIALGPVTNIALAMDKNPGAMKRVKKYWSMGTCGFGAGNASPVSEFNVYHDAEAYKVLADSGVPVTAVGLDAVTDKTTFSKEDFDKAAKNGKLSDFVSKSFAGLLKFYAEKRGLSEVDIPDGVAMACALWDGYLLETKACHASVITEDNEAYGQVILYQKGFGYDSGIKFDDYSFSVASKTADETFKETLIWLLKQ